jgi:CRP/FNR family transcriptional regulator, cyclic AMP receptor protein
LTVPPSGKLLQACTLFAGISLGELEKIARQLKWKRYRARQQIFAHLDESTDVYLVAEGSVRVIIYSPAGKEITYRDIHAGGHFGELAAIDDLPRSATVVASTDSLIACMSSKIFWAVLDAHPAAAAVSLRQLAALVRRLTERVYEFSALAVKNRVHAELLRLAQEHKSGPNVATIRPHPTHAELASRISTHREAVTRVLNELTRAGLIERRSGALVIRDLKRLDRLVQDPAVAELPAGQ